MGESSASAHVAPRPPGAAIELVPRTSGQILDVALDLARTRFGLYVLVATSVWLVSRGVQPLIGVSAMQEEMFEGDPGFGFLLMGVNGILEFVVATFALVSVTVFAWPSVTGTPFSFGASVRRALVCLVPVIGLQLITSLAVMPAFVCTCGVGGIYLLWKLSLAPVVYTLERSGFGTSLGRSFQLSSQNGSGWDAVAGFLRWLVVYGSAYVVGNVFKVVAGIVDQPAFRITLRDGIGLPEWAFDSLTIAVTSLFNGIATVLLALALLAYYVDCRVRRDGLDLRVRLATLESESAAAATPAAAQA